MQRKETYATTGPRMTVRFFGGWDFNKDDTLSRLPASVGYTKGVPMGGDLPTSGAKKAPSFLVAAMKDPYSGNLDRIQIVKGWLDQSGKTNEKVYDVVWSGGRAVGANGKLPPVGNTVDVKNQRLDRPGFRCDAARLLLRSCHRDSDAALDRLRGEAFRDHYVGRRSDDNPGARLHLADLVHAVSRSQKIPRSVELDGRFGRRVNHGIRVRA